MDYKPGQSGITNLNPNLSPAGTLTPMVGGFFIYMKTIDQLKQLQKQAELTLNIDYGLGSEIDIKRSEKKLQHIKTAIIYLEFNPNEDYLRNTRDSRKAHIVTNPGKIQDEQFDQLEFLNLILD